VFRASGIKDVNTREFWQQIAQRKKSEDIKNNNDVSATGAPTHSLSDGDEDEVAGEDDGAETGVQQLWAKAVHLTLEREVDDDSIVAISKAIYFSKQLQEYAEMPGHDETVNNDLHTELQGYLNVIEKELSRPADDKVDKKALKDVIATLSRRVNNILAEKLRTVVRQCEERVSKGRPEGEPPKELGE